MVAEVRTIIPGTIEFSAINREYSIPIDITRARHLVDIKIQVYSHPSVIPLLPTAQLTGGEDFRLYINEHNVTNAVTNELIDLLNQHDHEFLKSRYLEGAYAYINLARAMKLPESQIKNDLEKAEEIANNEDWSSKLLKLGDRSVGWSGNLHCLNFLYRFIPLEPISLNRVWLSYRKEQSEDLPEKLSDFTHLVCTLSQGGAPSYDTFDPSRSKPSGRLAYQLELLHKNPLEPRLKQIASKLKTISKQLEIQRIDYLTPIKSGVDIANGDIVYGNEETKNSLDLLTQAVKEIG